MRVVPDKITLVLWFRSAGIFLLGVTGVISSAILAWMVRVDITNERETDCVRELINEEQSLQGEINTRGWIALLAYVHGASELEIEMRAIEMDHLVLRWQEANERRLNANEIC